MKKVITAICLFLFLTGCTGHREELDKAMALRAKLLASQGVSFDATVTADYGDKNYTFSLNCKTDNQGNLAFTVVQPESIAGITGTITGTGGKLTFDDTALAFDTMADGQLSPVNGPWVLIHTLRSGYLTSCAQEGELTRVTIDDSYAENALHLDIWLDADNFPCRSDILWQGRRLLSIEVKNFSFL